jgi:hypothetical protein
VLVLDTESVNCNTPTADVVPVDTERLAADEVPVFVIGALTDTTPDEPAAPVAPVAPVAPAGPCTPTPETVTVLFTGVTVTELTTSVTVKVLLI